MMRVKDCKYIMTVIGGGWCYEHCLYAVTASGEVYKTCRFDEETVGLDTELDCEFIGKLDNVELDPKPKLDIAVMDAPWLTVYEVKDSLEVIHKDHEISELNPSLYEKIMKVEAEYIRREVNKEEPVKEIEDTDTEINFNDFVKKIKFLWITGFVMNIPAAASFFMDIDEWMKTICLLLGYLGIAILFIAFRSYIKFWNEEIGETE